MSDWLSLNNTVTVTETSSYNCVHLTVELKVKMHKGEVRQHVCSANAKFALLFASFTKRFNGARLPYTELGYPHDTSMLYSEWVIIITNTVNIFTFLIQAPYNIDIYKRSMKMKPVRQIMYSVDVTVCFSLCERIPMDILVGREGGGGVGEWSDITAGCGCVSKGINRKSKVWRWGRTPAQQWHTILF